MAEERTYEQIAEDRRHYLEEPDLDEWEPEPAPPPARARKSRHLTTMVSVRLSAEEADDIRCAAEAEGLAMSAFMRAAALDHTRRNDGTVLAASPYGNSNNVVRLVTFESGTPLNGELRPALGVV